MERGAWWAAVHGVTKSWTRLNEQTATNVCDSPGGSDGEASAYNAGDLGWRPGFDPWVGKICWRRKWQSTPVLLPGKSHEQKSLIGYSPWGRKESDTTERLHFTYYWGINHLKLKPMIYYFAQYPELAGICWMAPMWLWVTHVAACSWEQSYG